MRDALITLVAVFIAAAAVDDITTDHAAGFAAERTALVVCTAWFMFVAWRISQLGRRALGRASMAAALAFGLAQWAIGPGQAIRVEYVVTLVGLGWFVAVAGILAWSSRPGAR